MNNNKYIRIFTILKSIAIANSLFSIIALLSNGFITIITHVPLLTVCSIVINVIFLIALNKEDFGKLKLIASLNIAASVINMGYEFVLISSELTGVLSELKIAYIVLLLLLKLPFLILSIKLLSKCYNNTVKFTGMPTILYIIFYFAYVALGLYITSIPESNLEISIDIKSIIIFLITVATYYSLERSIEVL